MDYSSILNLILSNLDSIAFYVKFLLVLCIFNTFGQLYRGRS